MTTLDQIAADLDDTSSRGIARKVADLITTGVIAPRQRMPTTRELAQALGVSAGAVSDAWQVLVADGLLNTRGRQGTFVVDLDDSAPWRQFRQVQGSNLALDLSTGFPDSDLLVDLRPYLAQLATGARYDGYPTNELDPALAEVLTRHLPLRPTADNTILATHVLGAMSELFPVLGGPYSKVVVANPEFAPYLDLLERFRLEPLPVPMDDEGPLLANVERAVENGAAAIILQPRVHNPSGVVTSKARLRAIAELCAQRDVWIVDGDFYGDLLPVGPMSAAEWAPDQTVYMKGFSKEIHPDIRVAVMIGAPRLIGKVLRRRVGGFEVSRINQDLLRLALQDPSRLRRAAEARSEYNRRTTIFVETLAERGVPVRRSTGFNVWVPVRSESDALVYLAAKGIGVAPGSAFQSQGGSPHVRVSPVAITSDVRTVALLVAEAAQVGRRRGY